MSLRDSDQTIKEHIRSIGDSIRKLESGNKISARSWQIQENSVGDIVFTHMDGRVATLSKTGADVILGSGIGGGVTLGETSSTAYRGDRGKIAYDHSQIVIGNPHGTTKADVGLGLVPNVNLATAVALNSAKVTNATHTGDATGSGALLVVGLRGVGLNSSVSTPVDGDTLVYRSAGSDWVLEAKPTGGSGMTVVADQTARDAIPTPSVGLQVFRGDTKAIEVYNGTAWIAFDTQWQTYTPTIYTNNVAMTLGNGSFVGRYFRQGKNVSVKTKLELGTTTVWNGSGAHELSLPLASNYTTNIDLILPLGTWASYRSGVASTTGHVELISNTMRVALLFESYGNTTYNRSALSNTIPYTTASGDAMCGQFEYEIA